MYPMINDITTSFDNPPALSVRAKERPDLDLRYPSHFRATQEERYPLQPLRVKLPADQAYALALKIMQGMGWKVVLQDSGKKRLEAVSITPLLRFRDDVALEIRPVSGGDAVEVHMRSRSRLGRSDFGANHKRITNFFQSFNSSNR